ncbi:phage major capsid protein [Mycolicibacterium goodii]|uniref:phage major capsid protein n=1 Tax=Mycolicibacterium goodii TaxID=134601 RepID=UPI001BDD7945|nr:phage major capsid protein [Mycolicibacterium goodii]MBU8808957.1 phage major capsid protein [Mycolicibacterium goodii]
MNPECEINTFRFRATGAASGREFKRGFESATRDLEVRVAAPRADDTLERAFNSYLRTGQANQDIAELRAQSSGTDSAGGYLVPDQFLARIEERMKDYAGVESEAFVENVDNGQTVKLPTNDDTANKAVTVAENTDPASGGADFVFGEVEVEHHTYTTSGAGQNPIAVPFQLIQDANVDIQPFLINAIGERFGRGIADDFVNGTGAGEPFGIATNSTTTSTFTAADIDKDELIAALHDVDPAYRKNAVWIFSDGSLEAIRKLEDSTGRPLWTPQASAGLEGSIGGTLLGHRVVIDQAFATYADGAAQSWGVFGNINAGYWIRRVAGMRLIRDEVTGASQGQVKFTAHMRVGANVRQPRAYTVLKNGV